MPPSPIDRRQFIGLAGRRAAWVTEGRIQTRPRGIVYGRNDPATGPDSREDA